MELIIYPVDCRKTEILLEKMQSKNINFQICEDQEKIAKLDVEYLPCMSVDGKIYDYQKALYFLSNLKNNEIKE